MNTINFFSSLTVLLLGTFSFSQVGIGTTNIVPSAQLDVTSTTKGVLIPRMTYDQRNAIVTPAVSLTVWCTNCGTNGELQVYNGTAWTNLLGTAASYVIPGAPTSPIATAGNNQASVAFTAPVSNGGSTITSYTVTSSPGSFTAKGTTSPIVVTGLTGGTPYIFTVVATNAAGNSVASVASNVVTPYTVPGAPINPIATASNTQASVAFTAPVSNGGSTIVSYTVTSTPGNNSITGPTSPIVVTGLMNGTSYTFKVVATNIAGNSVDSTTSNAVMPYAVPEAPTNPIATVTAGSTNASIAFTAPASNGSAITGYTVTSNPGNSSVSNPTSPIVVSGLTIGTPYTFTVFATNAVGNSPVSVASNVVTPYTVPGAPTNPIATVTAGTTNASIAFTLPTANGSAITGYTVTSSPGNSSITGPTSPVLFTGLTGGTSYTFTVKATNAAGNSPASVVSNAVTPITVPNAPTSVIATAGDTNASVAFTAPAFNGGSAITRYTVTASPGGRFVTGLTSPLVVTGLFPDTSYTFTVKATNALGDSDSSAPSNTIMAITVPGAPSNPIATALYTKASVAFDESFSSTSYTVTSFPGGVTATGTASPILVTGLINGTTYTFTVKASNGAGTSGASNESNAVIPNCGAYTNTGTYLLFACYNLGITPAGNPVAIQSGGITGNLWQYGDLYQWGRTTDGHEKLTSTGIAVRSSNSLATSPSSVIGNFIYGYNDWRLYVSNTKIWGDGTTGSNPVKGVNDPCPTGFKVPSISQWASIFNGGSTDSTSSNILSPNSATANTWTWSSNYNGYFVGEYLFLPACGDRSGNNGQIENINLVGGYWSSTVDSSYSKSLFFNNSVVYTGNSTPRSVGLSVRCVSE